MHKIINNKYPGVTSLLFVLVIGLVLVVMVAGIATLTIREQQQASNTELSNRALQSAEAGVSVAVQKLIANDGYSSSSCKEKLADFESIKVKDSNNNTIQEITCMVIKSVFESNYESFVSKDRVDRLFMGPSSDASISPSYLSVKWNNPSLGDVSKDLATYSGGLYPLKDYPNAATIELTIVYWPKNGVTSDAFKISKFLLAPGKDNSIDSNLGVTSICPGTEDYVCATAQVSGKKGFDVKRAISLASTDSVDNYNFAIIVGSRYKSTHIQVSAYKSDGITNVPMRSANAQIDSTARAGNLYRRVKASRSTGLSGALENVLDGPIFSGMGPNDSTNRNICKNFTAIEDPAGSGSYKWSGSGTSPNCNNISL